MDTGKSNRVIVAAFYMYVIAFIGVLYYTYRLDRITFDIKVQSDQRRHAETDRFLNDFKP